MSAIEGIYNNAELAQASYANLVGGVTGSEANLAALQGTPGAGMSRKQAEEFAARYPEVVSQYNDAQTSFSATIFKDASGNLTLAIRGTQEGGDFAPTDTDIAVNGAGYDQILAMYNWWRQVSAPPGTLVDQYQLGVYPAIGGGDPPPGSVLLKALSTGHIYLEPAGEVEAVSVSAGNVYAQLQADSNQKLDVAGHSLGGHLAMAFNALFPSAVDEVVVFNAPGYVASTVNQNFFGALGGVVPTDLNSSNVTNVIADESSIGNAPWSAIAGLHSRPGAEVDIAIENQWLSDEHSTPAALNHSQMVLADSLAVYNVLHTLDEDLSVEDYKAILAASVQGTAGSYEAIVDRVGELFNTNNSTLPVGNLHRNALYEAIYGVKEDTFYQQLGNSMTITLVGQNGGNIASLASQTTADGLAARYALVNLNPFVITGNDALYAPHNTNGELNLENFTEQYLQDRALMLHYLVAANTADTTSPQAPDSYYFSDAESGRWFVTQNTGPVQTYYDRYLFGDDSANTLGASGNGGDDHLYGGGGADTLTGGAGIDYLEGGIGNDTLDGGTGDDTLVGGTGDDHYKFKNGDGVDTIVDVDGQGFIEIDGKLITAGVRHLGDDATTFHSHDGKYLFTQSGADLVISRSDGVSDQITIRDYFTPIGGGMGDPGLDDEPFLGIELDDEGVAGYNGADIKAGFFEYIASVESGSPSVVIPDAIAGANVVDDGPGSSPNPVTDGSDIIYGAGITDIQAFANSDDGVSASGTEFSHFEYGQGGDDYILGGVHNDKLEGNAGADVLLGGDGNDGLWGDLDVYGTTVINRRATSSNIVTLQVWGARSDGSYVLGDYGVTDDGVSTYVVYDRDRLGGGNDLLSGGDGDDFVEGNGGDDVLIGSYGNDTVQGDSGADYLSGGAGNDILNGDYSYGAISPFAPSSAVNYDDFLDGGEGNDAMNGGYGSDTLYGGAGNDDMGGDNWLDSLPAEQRLEGNDFMDGGAGNDTMVGHGGDDTLLGGEGSDSLWGDDNQTASPNAGNDYLDGGDGDDQLVGNGGDDTLYGGNGNDNLFGDDETGVDAGNDSLDGGDGDDYLLGYGGNDTLIGGDGQDTLVGEGDDDSLVGGVGGDTLYGGIGNDTLVGGQDVDYLSGGAGNDTYIVNAGDAAFNVANGLVETIDDSEGHNTLVLSAVNSLDQIQCRLQGNDLILQYGDQSLYIFNGASGAISTVRLGSGAVVGIQSLLLETLLDPIAITGTEAGGVVMGGLGNDTLNAHVGGGTLIGGAGNDYLNGNASDDVLEGGAGNDVLDGGAGSDQILGGDGNDTLVGTEGDNYLNAGAGDDVIYLDSRYGSSTIDLQHAAAGNTQILVSNLPVSGYEPILSREGESDVRVKFSNIPGSNGEFLLKNALSSDAKTFSLHLPSQIWSRQDLLLLLVEGDDTDNSFSGSDYNDTYHAHDGLDYLDGGSGSDTLDGGAGSDIIEGGLGNDFIIGGPGNDYLYDTEAGVEVDGLNDTYFFNIGDGEDEITDEIGDNVFEFGEGISVSDLSILTYDNYSFTIEYGESGDNIKIYGLNDGDLFRFSDESTSSFYELIGGNTSSEFNDLLVGSSGGDVIDGLPGNDTILSYAGDDVLSGGDGADYLHGGAGNDVINSGAGDDVIFGGLGNDVVNGGLGNDQIIDNDRDFLGGGVNDTYIFNAGDGVDSVSDYYGDNVFLFGDSVESQDFSVHRVSPDTFEFYYSQQADYVRAAGFNQGDIVSFSDGASLTYEQIVYLSSQGTELSDYISGDGSDNQLFGRGGDDTLSGQQGNDLLDGGAGFDYLYGDAGSDTLVGGEGRDSLFGGDGGDIYLYGRGDGIDTIVDASSNPAQTNILRFGEGITPDDLEVTEWWSTGPTERSLQIKILENGLDIGDKILLSNYILNSSSRNYRFEFGSGEVWGVNDIHAILTTTTSNDDHINAFEFSETIDAGDGNDQINGNAGEDLIIGGGGNDHLSGGLGNDTLQGGEGNDLLVGYADWVTDSSSVQNESGMDTLEGGNGNDTLRGGAGNDLLVGGQGNDALQGGMNDDTYLYARGDGIDYLIDTGGVDIIRMAPGVAPEDIELYQLQVGWSYGLAIVVDGLASQQIVVSDYFGPSTDKPIERIEFDDGSVWLAGDIDARVNFVGEVNTLPGTSADDIFTIDNEYDQIVEGVDGGIDSVYSSRSYILPENVENLTLIDVPLNISATGNSLNNALTGNSGNNRFEGGAGIDTAIGGDGNDLYYGIEVVIENAGGGIDTYFNRYGGLLPDNVENFDMNDGVNSWSVNVVTARGNDLDNTMWSTGAGINGYVLDGGAGADTMIARGWDAMVFVVDNGGDRVIASATGSGRDVVRSYIDYTLPDYVENLELIGQAAYGSGNSLANYLKGNASDNMLIGYGGLDTLEGGSGSDTLDGGGGDDELLGGDASDLYLFGEGFGIDTIYDASGSADAVRFSFAMPAGVTVSRIDADLLIGIGSDSLLIRAYFSGAQSSIEQIEFLDGVWTRQDVDDLLSTGEPTNQAPVVAVALSDANAVEDATFSYTIPAENFIDADAGDVLSYGAHLVGSSALPDWLSFDAVTRTLSGTPTNGDVGTIDIRITATDGAGASVSDDFQLTISNVNNAPVVAVALSDANATEGSMFSYIVPATSFTDADVSDVLTYTALLADGSELPSWLSFDTATRTLSGAPTNDDVGALDVRIIATDGAGASVSDDFQLTISNINNAPVVAVALSDASASEGAAFSYTVPAASFTDADSGHVLSYGAQLADGSVLPGWLSFDAATRTLSGIPDNNDVGVIDVRIIATDNLGASVSDDFQLTISNVNNAPVVAVALSDASTMEGAAFSYTIPAASFADSDAGDVLTYGAQLADGSALPDWLSFNTATRTLSGTPTNGDVGALDVRITATDGAGASVSDDFQLSISNVNNAPVVAVALSDASASEGAVFSYTIPASSFTDADAGDVLTYGAQLVDGSALPDWLSFDTATRTLSGTPTNGDVGVLNVRIMATDGAGASVSDDFQLSISNVNNAPVVAVALSDASATEGDVFSYTVPASSFTDADSGDVLNYVAQLADGSALPDWLSFDTATRTLSGTPANGDVGVLNVRITATDGAGASVSDDFQIAVNSDNNAPIAVPDQIKGFADLPLTFAASRLLINDTDSESALQVVGVSSGAQGTVSFDAASGLITFTPTSGFVGEASFTYQVSDGELVSDASVNLSVVAQPISGEEFYGGGSSNVHTGTALNDYIETYSANDTVNGGAGDDYIYSGAGNDRVTGGAGSDVLVDISGNDTFVLNRGSGTDIVLDFDGNPGNDRLVLGPNILPTDIEVVFDDRGLWVGIIGTEDRMLFAYDMETTALPFGSLQFTKTGQTIASSAFLITGTRTTSNANDYKHLSDQGDMVNGGAGDDTLLGYFAPDVLVGGAGNDLLDGGQGDDILFGGEWWDVGGVFGGPASGSGNDTLIGGHGHDLYIASLEQGGNITIDNVTDATEDDYDALQLIDGTAEQLWFRQAGDDLIMEYVGYDGAVTLENWYSDPASRVDVLLSDDGYLYQNDVDALVSAMAQFAPPVGMGSVIDQATQQQLQTAFGSSWNFY